MNHLESKIPDPANPASRLRAARAYFEPDDGSSWISPAQFSSREGYNRDGEAEYELENGANANESETD